MAPTCTYCQFDNPPGMRFCGACGKPLETTATGQGALNAQGGANALGAPNTLGAPNALGVMMGAGVAERLRQAGIQAAGQRRSVTVLFADLCGSTPLSLELDSEDLFDLIQRYIQILIEAVYKYEGIVDKLTGDGLMALFGAPISLENNAERAVRCALDMQAGVAALGRELQGQIGSELNMRVGLHCGEVIIGGVGSDLMMDYTAIGDTVNLARRVEESAPPGAILVSESVQRQVRALFDCQPISILNPKGITRPVPAWRVLGQKLLPGRVRGIEGLYAPMVGREAELASLRQALNGLVKQRRGCFALVTGEAGIGKSRLTSEFKAGLQDLPLKTIEGQCHAYRAEISYWLIQELVQAFLGVKAGEPTAVLHTRLVEAAGALGERAGELLPYLEQALSLPHADPLAAEHLRFLEPGQLHQQVFAALRELLLSGSQRAPLLMVLEDLHWADEESLGFLKFLAGSVRQAPLMILAISRQADGALAQAGAEARQSYSENFLPIALQSLSSDQSERLLRDLLNLPELPGLIRSQILQRSAGIPFYLEEILRMLIDAGALLQSEQGWQLAPGVESLALQVPETVQGLILARYDRLDRMQRRTLQVAAVIGKDFSRPVLERILTPEDPGELSASLDSLVDRQFLVKATHGAAEGYSFRHILMSEAIYGTLLRRERRRLHGLVGAAIEELYAADLESQVELLANHYRLSNAPGQALHYLLRAAEKATRNQLNHPARLYFEQAAGLLGEVEHTTEQAGHVYRGLGDALVFAGDYPAARQKYESALTCLASTGCSTSPLFRKLARTFERQGDYEQALVYLQQAAQQLELGGPECSIEQAQVLSDQAWIHFRRANFAEAESLLEAALGLVEDSDAYEVIASVYNRLGGVEYNQGDWDRAAGYLRKSIALRESIGDLVGLATSFNNLGLLEVEIGEFDNAFEHLRQSYELKQRLGQAEGMAMALVNLGCLRIQRGELSEARQALDQALELVRPIGYSSLLRQALKSYGELHLAAQEWQAAAEVLSEIAPDLKELGAHDQLLDTYRLLGEAALGSGDLAQADYWSEQAGALVASLGNESSELSAVQRGELRRFYGCLARARGDFDQAAGHFHVSETIFQNLRSRFYQGRIAYELGALAETQGERLSAMLHYREAALLFRSMGARLEEQRSSDAHRRLATRFAPSSRSAG